ncbi:variant erythrocyte surface antigen-1 family protein, partial [Babesia divergens]
MSQHKSLLVCPKNLKECIDWVLRATGMDTGQVNNIVNLKDALETELKGSELNGDLDQLNALASGLGFLAGLPACLCKTKKSVEEGLRKIYEELENFNCDNLKLNCPSCSKNLYPCKCCVIQSIKDVKGCPCINGNKAQCHCAGQNVSCAKVLAGLEACLHLQCLQADMNEICECNDSECCKGKPCTGNSPSCGFCKTPKTPVPTTGLGLSPPNPIRLAQRLETFFGSAQGPKSCDCTCNGSPPSCCCLACPDGKCFDSCTAGCGSQGCSSHGSSKDCPCKTFCIAINSIKVLAKAGAMTCCSKGAQCHCSLGLTSGSKCSGSPNCCTAKKSLKCLLRRVVSYFKDLDASNQNFFKSCCELLCVKKTCDFLWKFYGKRTATECSKCRKKGQGCSGTSVQCCNGTISQCTAQDCCKDCEVCCAVKFSRALEELRFAGPCGQDLYRVLKDFLECCGRLRGSLQYVEIKLHTLAKCCQVQKNINGQSCTCCSTVSATSPSKGSCEGCKDLLKDSKLMSVLLSQYSSSYDSSSAKWDSLCSSKPCCSNPSCPKCSGSCPSNGCCEKCPKRLCAKIFLGMLPCLYYGLKIVFDRCQYGSDFPDWSLQNISQGSIGKFLSAWGFDLNPLKSKNASGLPPILDILYGSGKFKSLFDLVSKEYFSIHLSSGSHPPTTVREMLLWLYGLRFHKHFSDLVLYCSSLCSPFGNSFHPDAFCYYIHLSCFLVPVSFISTVQHSDSHVSTFFSTADSEFSKFSYPEDPSELLEKLCEYVRKIFVALNFLYYQCKNDRNSAGWHDCAFGRGCAEKFQENSSTSGSSSPVPPPSCSCSGHETYLCSTKSGNPIHDHCLKGSCRGFPGSSDSCDNSNSVHPQSNGKPGQKCSSPCPHPLMRFLIDDSSESKSKPQSQSPSSPFRLPSSFARLDFSQSPPVILDASSEILTMGFKTEQLPFPGRRGYSIYDVIRYFCYSGFYPLTRLAEFSLCVSRNPPETLGELFGFFLRFSESDVFKNFGDYVDGEPGRFLGKALQDAVQGLYGSEDSHSGSSHSAANLFSLSECHANIASGASCGPYLSPLAGDVSGVFTPELCSMYLSWICYLAKDFKTLLERFHAAAHEKFKSCCLSSSCKNIVSCPCALPFLYSNGFGFRSPATLSGGKKSCADFVTQLDNVVKGDPFKALLRIIDEFIWSIRLPFIYAFLYIWILVISYFYYVQFYKLDLLHIDSH